MTDFVSFKEGNLALPIAGAVTNPLLQDADPALYHVLKFLSWSLNNYLSTRVVNEATAWGLSGVTAAVMYAMPTDPVPYLTSEQAKFPLLAAYRRESTFKQHTLVKWDEECRFEVLYCLPPLTAGERDRVGPILRAAAAVLFRSCELGTHPSYTPPGGTLGASAFAAAAAGICSIGVTRATYGDVPWSGDLFVPSVILEGMLTEQFDLHDVSALEAFAGGDVAVDVAAAGNTNVLANVATTPTD